MNARFIPCLQGALDWIKEEGLITSIKQVIR
jgi:hypothetical protein